jgi:hypothetical protein
MAVKELINVFYCPICNNTHQTSSNYSRVVCNRCIKDFGITNKIGDTLEIINDDNMFFTKVDNHYSKNKECYVKGYPCYIVTSECFYDNCKVVCTLPIPYNLKNNNINKLILRNNYININELSNQAVSKSKSLLSSLLLN